MNETCERERADLFTRLLEDHREGLADYIERLTRDGEKSRDIFQETLLTAFQKFSSLKDPAAFPGWIRKIAYRIFLSYDRSRSATASLTFLEERYETEIFSPEYLLDKEERLNELYRTLGDLKRRERKMFLLYYLFGHSHREIARRFAITEAASKKRLERIRLKFCRLWEEGMPKMKRRPANDTLHDINLQASYDRASWMGELTLIEAMLMDGLDINEPDLNGRTLLHYAVLSGNGEAVALLIRNGAHPSAEDKFGATPQSLAADHGLHAIGELLK